MISAWPIEPSKVIRIGQGVCADCRTDKKGNKRPHNGVDIFADGATAVVSPVYGRVIRVVDGRQAEDDKKRAAGLWIDIEEYPDVKKKTNRRIHRFLHLGSATVKDGDKLSPKSLIGYIAEANTSGLGDATHLHYEIRETSATEAYGAPIDPRYDLADAVATHAWSTIPTIAHVVGVERYGDPRYIKVANAVRKVWNESDPDNRLVLAHDADEEAKRQGQRSIFSAARESATESAKENIVNPAREALKEAGKEISSQASEWWNEIPTAYKVVAAVAGIGAVVAVVKTATD